MPEPYLLGIDIGTSVVKSVIFDCNGNEVVVSRSFPEIIRAKPDWSEVSMEDLWQSVVRTVREVAHHDALRGHPIVGIGLSGTACGAWLIDDRDKPVRNAILWNDGRAADVVGEWQQTGVLDEIFNITGNSLFPGYPISVLRWLVQNEPETMKKARAFMFCKDWIRFRLTGQIATDHSDTSYMPYDIQRGDYSDKLLQICGIESTRHLFPMILESGEIAGEVIPKVAESLGLAHHIPVVIGLTDLAATTFGAGVYLPGQACSIIGTSLANNLILDSLSFEPFGIGAIATTVGGAWLRTMTNTSGTINLQWFIDQFCATEKATEAHANRNIYTWAEEEAAKIPLGSGGIIYHPYLNTAGVISPFVNPAARAEFFGISIEHSRAHLLRAVYEGTALSMLDSYLQMPIKVTQLTVSGGGTRSRFWCQMFADCTGREILVPTGSEFGARGVAVLAGIASGMYLNLDEAMHQVIRVENQYEPNPVATEKYRGIYELYRHIYKHLNDDWWERRRLLSKL